VLISVLVKQRVFEDEYGALVEWHWKGKSEVLGEEPVAVLLSPPQNSYYWPGIETGTPWWEAGD